MTDTVHIPLDIVASPDDDTCEPSEQLVKELADRVTEAYGKSARLHDIATCAQVEKWTEIDNLDDGAIEVLFEEIRDELAVRDNGMRR